MQKHVKLYMKHYDYGEQDFVPCEHCGSKSVDIHHIDPKGMGGSKTKDYVENLIALCRKCHDMAHNEELTKGDLMLLHRRKGASTKEMGKRI